MLKKATLFSAAILLSVISISPVDAKEEKNTVTLNDGLTIERYADGGVVPIVDNEHLTENELDQILLEIGYDDSFINRQDKHTKRSLVSNGGEIVEVEASLNEQYVDSDGNVHDVNSANSEEVREIQEQDLKEINVSEAEFENYNLASDGNEFSALSCSTPFEGMCNDGDFSGTIMVNRMQPTSSSYRYNVMLDFTWQGTTNVNFGDEAALHWGTTPSPVANTQNLYRSVLYNNGNQTSSNHSVNNLSNYGVGASFFLEPVNNNNIQYQGGILEQDIFIPRSTNADLTITAAYAHPWIPDWGGLSINSGSIGFSWSSGIGSRWQWQLNYNPQ